MGEGPEGWFSTIPPVCLVSGVSTEELAAAQIRIAQRLQNCNYQPGCSRCGKSGLHQRLTPCVPPLSPPPGLDGHAWIPQQPPWEDTEAHLRPPGQSSEARSCLFPEVTYRGIAESRQRRLALCGAALPPGSLVTSAPLAPGWGPFGFGV